MTPQQKRQNDKLLQALEVIDEAASGCDAFLCELSGSDSLGLSSHQKHLSKDQKVFLDALNMSELICESVGETKLMILEAENPDEVHEHMKSLEVIQSKIDKMKE